MRERTLINVCCPGRSGSTMVDLVLGNANNAFSLGEVYAWFRPWRKHHFTIRCSCGQTPCFYWEKIKNHDESKFHARAFEDLGVDFLIDSSKNMAWIVDAHRWGRREGFRVFNLLLYKEPVDIIYSHWKRGQTPAFALRNYKKYYERFFSMGLGFSSLSLKSFSTNPKGMLDAIAAQTGLSNFEGKERFWEKESHHLFGSAGTRGQAERESGVIRKKEGFKPEFEEMVPELERRIAADEKLGHILKTLREADVTMGGQAALRETPRYGLWYLKNRAYSAFRRRFPQNFKDPFNQN